jgi:hypothetical protein
MTEKRKKILRLTVLFVITVAIAVFLFYCGKPLSGAEDVIVLPYL